MSIDRMSTKVRKYTKQGEKKQSAENKFMSGRFGSISLVALEHDAESRDDSEKAGNDNAQGASANLDRGGSIGTRSVGGGSSPCGRTGGHTACGSGGGECGGSVESSRLVGLAGGDARCGVLKQPISGTSHMRT